MYRDTWIRRYVDTYIPGYLDTYSHAPMLSYPTHPYSQAPMPRDSTFFLLSASFRSLYGFSDRFLVHGGKHHRIVMGSLPENPDQSKESTRSYPCLLPALLTWFRSSDWNTYQIWKHMATGTIKSYCFSQQPHFYPDAATYQVPRNRQPPRSQRTEHSGRQVRLSP